jgi:hypothetical protein
MMETYAGRSHELRLVDTLDGSTRGLGPWSNVQFVGVRVLATQGTDSDAMIHNGIAERDSDRDFRRLFEGSANVTNIFCSAMPNPSSSSRSHIINLLVAVTAGMDTVRGRWRRENEGLPLIYWHEATSETVTD